MKNIIQSFYHEKQTESSESNGQQKTIKLDLTVRVQEVKKVIMYPLSYGFL